MRFDLIMRRKALAPALALAGVLAGVLAGAGGHASVAAQEVALPLPGGLSPAEMMALYQAECAGGAGAGAVGDGPAAARSLGQRCDALARAIQGVSLEDRRAGSADLVRPEFYTPGAR